jgi:PAS domain S-box-containing protein
MTRLQGWIISIFLGLLCLIGLLILNGLALRQNLQILESNQEQVRLLQALIHGTGQLFGSVRDAETGQRGYLLTQDRAYLRPYQSAILETEEQFSDLKRLSGDDANRAMRFKKLQLLVKDKFEELATTIEALDRGEKEKAIAIVQSGQGRQLMVQIRELLQEIEQSERERLRSSGEETQSAWETTRVSALIGFITSVAGCCGFVWLLIRYLNHQHEAAIRLQYKRELLQATLTSIGDGMIATDSQGKITLMNDIAQDLTGWSLTEVLGKDLTEIFQIVNMMTRNKVPNPIERALSEGKIVGLANHTVLIARDGTEHLIDDSASPIRLKDGTVSGAVLVFRDVTERYRAEDKLRLSERRYRSLALATSEVVWTCDAKGRLISIEGGESFIDPTTSPLDDQFWERIMHPDDRPLIKASWATAFETQSPFATPLRLKRLDGQWRYTVAHGYPVLDESKNIQEWVGMTVDITEEREVEERFRKALQLEAIGRLAGGIAHDFNNLLTVVSGYTDIILSSLDLNDPNREMMEQIQSCSGRAASLTRQLLAYSRKTFLDQRVVNVNEFIQQLEPMLKKLLGDAIELRFDFGAGLMPIRVDPHALEQSILNLCFNSRDAMPNGGQLTIKTADGASDSSMSDLSNHMIISVIDTGEGMTEAVKTRIFEPFFTTKGIGKGSGLGLSEVEGFVQQSGGKVFVESTPNVGTTMKLVFRCIPSNLALSR